MYKVEVVIASNIHVLGAEIQRLINKHTPNYVVDKVSHDAIEGNFGSQDYTAVIVFKKEI